MTTKEALPTHPVTERLWGAGIRSVVVIDDAYNRPVLEDLRLEVGDFWAEIVRDEVALAELRSIKPGLNSEDDIDEEVIDQLWAQTLKEEQSALLRPCRNVLFSRQLQAQSELVVFVDNLVRIGITPIRLGISDDLPRRRAEVVLFGFHLGVECYSSWTGGCRGCHQQACRRYAEDPAIQASINKAKQILQEFDDAFIILMSSKEGVERARDSFRRQTGLIGGMFDYVDKKHLANERGAVFEIRILGSGATDPS